MGNEEIINLIDRIHEVECLAAVALGVAVVAIIALAFVALRLFIERE